MKDTIILRDYQEKAVRDIFDYVCNNSGNPVVIAPTGSGKSVIIAEIIRRSLAWWPGTRVLVLTHQKELIEQDMDKLHRIAPDLDLGVYSASLGSKDASHDVTFASIQSICKNREATFNFVIVDECHLINNDESGNYRSYLGTLNCKVVGFTATPYRLGQGEIVGEGTIFDHYIETIGILEMQRRGYLCRLRSKLTLTEFNLKNVGKAMGEYKQGELDKAVNTLRNNEAVAKELAWYVANAGIKHMVVFCTSVEHAYAMKSLLCSLDVSTICVEGKMDKKAREEAIAEFTSGKAVCATNVNVLSIGFDYPEIDCIAMLRPTLSTALYVQQAGRGLRIAEGKESCLLLDFAGNVKRHGPVGNLSSIPSAKKGKGGSGVPPMKVCPECLEIVQASSRVCPTCGHEFPVHPKEFRLFMGDVNGDEGTAHLVNSWSWINKTSKKGQKMWMITYDTCPLFLEEDEMQVKEFLVYDENAHPYARNKAYQRMKEFSRMAGMDPGDYVMANGSIDWNEWGTMLARHAMPYAMVTVKDKDFTRVTKMFSEKEILAEYDAENEESARLKATKERMKNDYV